MSLQDSLFSEDVENDITLFSKDERRKRDPKLNVSTFRTSRDTKTSTMGVQGQCSPTSTPEHGVQKQRPVKTVPTVEIYRPPAARKPRSVAVTSDSLTDQPISESCVSTKTSRQKRPDRAVYVPRHRRSLEAEGSPVRQEKSRSDRQRDRDSVSSPVHTAKTSRNPVMCIPEANSEELNSESQPEEANTCSFLESQQPDTTNSSKYDSLWRNPDNSLDGESSNSSDFILKPSKLDDNFDNAIGREAATRAESQSLETENDASISASDSLTFNINITVNNRVEENNRVCESKSDSSPIDRRKRCEIEVKENSVVASNEENCDIEMSTAQNCPKIEDDASRRDKAANQKNKRISHNSVSNVLIISNERKGEDAVHQEVSVTPMTPPEKKVKKIERPKSKPAAPPSPHVKVSREECDWDSLFDDNGDCLDPTLIDELSSAVGEVTIEQPKNSYKTYTKIIEVSNDEFAHVVEIYNFPSEFKTCDLIAVFSPFKSGGFELKWVDDTHCLGVFSSPRVAAEVLASDHPFVKTRPLSEATALSKTKARKGSEFLQPYRNRPETCAALARRLVTGALGVRLATARQEREREKIVLREAKEKKKLANKQRDDAWEGVIGEK
ncbi:coiled-coil domain-containing protein R3HCC1L isoform X2 [Belonocnema kinseyi]|uniref:coiled-coil domain-containing protein R3HCC1L isoform X2 n=1 Tax=Belonocnema kinseyi TaxID=2817044 RepID=UPI00143D27DC|nr:coiled-coil domain-containing protein R3HCC1L isoform X2 [Belonocnema kinseyi]